MLEFTQCGVCPVWCFLLSLVMLSLVMLSLVMLSLVMLSLVMLGLVKSAMRTPRPERWIRHQSLQKISQDAPRLRLETTHRP